jgi:hypothetical protein
LLFACAISVIRAAASHWRKQKRRTGYGFCSRASRASSPAVALANKMPGWDGADDAQGSVAPSGDDRRSGRGVTDIPSRNDREWNNAHQPAGETAMAGVERQVRYRAAAT